MRRGIIASPIVHDDREPWSDGWPGEEECVRLGLFCREDRHGNFVECGPDDKGALPDVELLHEVCAWDRDERRFVPLEDLSVTDRLLMRNAPLTLVRDKPRRRLPLTLPSWEMILRLALQHRWLPAAAFPLEVVLTSSKKADLACVKPAGNDNSLPEDWFERLSEPTPQLAYPGRYFQAEHAYENLFPDDPLLRTYVPEAEVTDEDAEQLARALDRGLPGLTQQDPYRGKVLADPRQKGGLLVPEDDRLSPQRWLSGPRVKIVHRVIDIAQKGGFRILS